MAESSLGSYGDAELAEARRLLRTPVTSLLEIDFPIVSAPMGGIAGGELAGAVSAAGGLGMVAGAFMTGADLEAEISRARTLTDRPIGVGLVFPTLAGDEAVLAKYEKMAAEEIEVVLEASPALLSAGLGVPEGVLAEARRRGIKVAQMIGSPRHVDRVRSIGCDLIVAQGTEAGGHTGNIATMPLVPQIVDAVTVPVLAAGGIFDGRGLAASLMLGAGGVWVGTRFAVTKEALGHQQYKERVAGATSDQAILTRAYTGKQLRVIRNSFTQEWDGRAAEILPFPAQREAIGDLHFAARLRGDVDRGAVTAGQACGGIEDIGSAGAVVRELAVQASQAMARWVAPGG